MKRLFSFFLGIIIIGGIAFAAFFYFQKYKNNDANQPGGLNNSSSTPETSTSSTVTSVQILNEHPAQGDTFVVTMENSDVQSATLNGKAMQLFNYKNGYRAIYPISDIMPTGNYPLKIVFKSGKIFEKTIAVGKTDFPVIAMGKPGPPPTPEIAARLAAETKDFEDTFKRPAEEAKFSAPFIIPLKIPLKIVSVFGEERKDTAGGIVRHLGIDFGAPIGTTIYSMNDGVVVKAKKYLAYGNTIVVDHGGGIYSIYLHMSVMDVREGDQVKQNQILGLSGDTGYVTGPHLHLSLKIAGTSVDPLRFVDTFQNLK
jgi:murein DD-endopeptidase MepM/ murein hydrolase activator NlpD